MRGCRDPEAQPMDTACSSLFTLLPRWAVFTSAAGTETALCSYISWSSLGPSRPRTRGQRQSFNSSGLMEKLLSRLRLRLLLTMLRPSWRHGDGLPEAPDHGWIVGEEGGVVEGPATTIGEP